MRFQRVSSLLIVLALILVIRASNPPARAEAAPTVPQSQTTRVSVAADGTEGNSGTYNPALSGEGTHVAFISAATNLTADPPTGASQAFVKNLISGAVTMVSVSTEGEPGDDYASDPVLSETGRYVAFESLATNLVTSTVNSWLDVFVHDVDLGTTTQVSVSSVGTPGDANSENPALSADGRYVVFESSASNLIAGDYPPYGDVFLHDRDADHDGIFDEPGEILTLRLSQTAGGTPANGISTDPSISANGRWVVFTSSADNLVAGDENAANDIFLYDRDADADDVFDEPDAVSITLISTGSGGVPADGYSSNPAISPDGSQVAFESFATNLIPGGTALYSKHIFVRDWQAGVTALVSQSTAGDQANAWSNSPALSETGRWIVFSSQADNLITPDTNYVQDIFLRDRDVDADGVFDEAGQVATFRVSVDSLGGQMEGGQATEGAISWGGSWIVFDSDASNLVLGDNNFESDVFLYVPTGGGAGADLTLGFQGEGSVLGLFSTLDFTLQNLGPELALDTNVLVTVTGDRPFSYTWTPPSQGSCGSLTSGCAFGPVSEGETISFALGAIVTEDEHQVYQGTVAVELKAISSTTDPVPVNNHAVYSTSFYNCSADDSCVLDDIVCALFHPFPGTVRTTLGEFIPNLALYYHVRDQVMTSPTGQRYTDLYYAHSDEISTLVFADDNLWNLALDGLFQWEPNFTALIDGDGDTAEITAPQIQVVEDFLDALSAAGTPALQQAIAEELANLPPLDTFVGMTMEEARGEVVGYAVYLPGVQR